MINLLEYTDYHRFSDITYDPVFILNFTLIFDYNVGPIKYFYYLWKKKEVQYFSYKTNFQISELSTFNVKWKSMDQLCLVERVSPIGEFLLNIKDFRCCNMVNILTSCLCRFFFYHRRKLDTISIYSSRKTVGYGDRWLFWWVWRRWQSLPKYLEFSLR